MFSKALRSSTRSLSARAAFTPRCFSSTPSRALEAVEKPLSLWNFTEEENMIRETVAKFAQDVILPRSRDMDEKEQMDEEVIKGLFDNGLMGIETPAEYEGSGCSFTSAIIAVEELAKVDASVAVLCDVHNTLVNTVLRHYGTEEIKAKWLPGLATNTVGSFCLSEPNAGSDAFGLQTTAKKDSDGGYILNGSKAWISNSGEADTFLVFANVDPSKGYKGITCFVMSKDMGVQIAKKEKKLGIRSSSTCVLSFDDVKVPKENIVGEIGKGYKIAIEILNEGRIGIAAQMVGVAQGAFDYAVGYAYQRKQFGKYIGDFQKMGTDFAQAAIKIEAARLMTYNAARLKEEGRPFTKEAAMAKYFASTIAGEVTGAAVEWAGGVGFTRDLPLEKFWRDSKIGAIYEGTSNIQLDTVSKMLRKQYIS